MPSEAFDINDDLSAVGARENLWRAVLLNTIEEAVHGAVVGVGEAKERIKLITAAREYLAKPSRDFDPVCSLAGLEPDAVRERAVRLINEAPSPEALATTSRRTVKADAAKPGPKPRIMKTFEYQGLNLTISEWAERTGVKASLIRSRLAYGWSISRALEKTDGRMTARRVNGKRPATGWRAPGVGFNFGRSKGTGGGSTAQETTNLSFSGNTNASSNA